MITAIDDTCPRCSMARTPSNAHLHADCDKRPAPRQSARITYIGHRFKSRAIWAPHIVGPLKPRHASEIHRDAQGWVSDHQQCFRHAGDHMELTLTDAHGWPLLVSGATLEAARDMAVMLIEAQIAEIEAELGGAR